MNRNKKRVLIIAYDGLGNSGVPYVIYNTIKSLHNYYDFDVVCFTQNDYYVRKLKNEGITGIKYHYFILTKPNNFLSKLFYYLFKRDRFYFKKTYSLLMHNNYYALHSFKEYDGAPFLRAAKKAGVEKRIFHTNINQQSNFSLFSKVLTLLHRNTALKNSNAFIGVSELSCKSTFKGQPYKIIYNPFDESKYRLKNDRIEQTKLILSHISTFSSNKNQLFSLAVAKALKEMGSNFILNIVGREVEDGYVKKMESFIKDNKLEPHVNLVLNPNDVSEWFYKSCYTMLPSYYEGASIVAVESQACGKKMFVNKSISSELNVGGLIFLDINAGPITWAKRIIEEFTLKTYLTGSFNVSKFSFETFQQSMIELYSHQN